MPDALLIRSRGKTIRWWKHQSRDEFQRMVREVMHSIGQRRGRWVYDDQCQYLRRDRRERNSSQPSKAHPDGDQRPICNIPLGLIGLIAYLYHQVATSFPEARLQRTPGLSVLGPEQFQDG
jgi:hypothetical protein